MDPHLFPIPSTKLRCSEIRVVIRTCREGWLGVWGSFSYFALLLLDALPAFRLDSLILYVSSYSNMKTIKWSRCTRRGVQPKCKGVGKWNSSTQGVASRKSNFDKLEYAQKFRAIIVASHTTLHSSIPNNINNHMEPSALGRYWKLKLKKASFISLI